MARVSIIIPAYNAASFLDQTLDSVLKQTFEDWEVVLVDDGSTDGTLHLVKQRMPSFGGRLRYFYQQNRGLPAARNTGLRAASGVYIALLDADDVWLERRLERGVRVLDENPEVGLVHGPVTRIDANGCVFENPARPAWRYLSGSIAAHIYTRRAHILCPTVTFRASCLQSAGVFDETLRATEDRDLWFRIAERFPVAYIDEVLAHYRISVGGMSQDLDRMLAAQLQFVKKHRRNQICSGAYREALAAIYRERGDALFNRGELWNSMFCYSRSIWYYPPAVKNTYMLARALLDPVVGRLNLSKRRGLT